MLPSLLFAIACRSDDAIDFPAVLGPLEEVNRAPSPRGDEPFPEAFEVVSGGDDDLWWAHGRGFIHAPVDVVWVHARRPEVCVDSREVDEWTVEVATVAGFDASYTIHNTVHDVVTVDYDTTWVHEVQEGTVAQAELVVAQWDKTDGTVFIDLLAGSLLLLPADDETTEVQMIEHLKATLRDDETIARYLRDYYADLLAAVEGAPLIDP